jgi:hypothetical protein
MISKYSHSTPIPIPNYTTNTTNTTKILYSNYLSYSMWRKLCSDPRPYAISIIEKNIDMVDWDMLSTNPAAIHILQRYIENVRWRYLLYNPNPDVIDLVDEFVL